jgi:RNA polymerase sigma factor (sigma-70 family)
MSELNDHELLEQYAQGRREQAETAFAALAERHVDLVYSTALRSIGNAHAAEEITQAVFIILANKAENLSRDVVLSGWLYQTARLTAANFLRGEIRRQKREQEAFVQSTLLEEKTDNPAWRQIAPLLDEALGQLGERDRNAIVLRFFENKNLREVGLHLGTNEGAAKMRVNRALEKLRKIFGKRGAVFSAAAIAGAVSANSVHAAPAGLAKIISAVAITKGATAGGSTLALVKGAVHIMAWSKLKIGIVTGAIVLLAVGTTTAMVHYERQKQPRFPPPVPVAPGQTEFPRSTWRFAGFGDPVSAFQSTMWAVGNDDVKTMVATVSPALQQNFAGKPDYQIITPKDQVDFGRMTGYRILNKQVVSDHEVVFETYAEGLDQTRKFSVQRIGGEWKLARHVQ